MNPTYPHGDPDVVVRGVLAQSGYRAAAPTTAAAPQKSIIELIWDWFYQHVVAPLMHPISRAFAASHGVGTAIGLVLVVVALGLLGFVVFRLAVALAGPAIAGRTAGRTSRALEGTLATADWRALARDAAARGAYREAISALFRAALAALDERAIVAFDAARTPGEYRRAVRRARVDAAESFDDLTDGFVRAAFAGTTPQAAEFAAAERAFATFEPALGA